jgi:hypothetical protein
MNPPLEHPASANEERSVRRPYEKPEIQRVDLALAETLGGGCKLDGECNMPPITIRDEVGS